MKSVKASKPDVNKYFARGDAESRRRLIVNHINKILFALLALIYSLPLRAAMCGTTASPRARIFSNLKLIYKKVETPNLGVSTWIKL